MAYLMRQTTERLLALKAQLERRKLTDGVRYTNLVMELDRRGGLDE